MLRHFTYSDENRVFYGFRPMYERVFPQPARVLVAQTTRETPAAPMAETFIAPTLLPACCLC